MLGLLSPQAFPYPPLHLEKMGWLVAIARILVGVVIVFAWRAIMQPTLLMGLPPLFRVIEDYGLAMPRRYFLSASQYETVKTSKDDDNVIPSVRSIPSLISNLRRRRAISVGPQSEADAYEAMAFREKKRRDSINASTPMPASPVRQPLSSHPPGFFSQRPMTNGDTRGNRSRSSSLDQYKAQMGEVGPGVGATPVDPLDDSAEKYEEEQTKELFAHLQKPRVRYDVEVVTKLIVYSGIAWLAVEGNPIIFDLVGLGLK